MTSFDLCLDSRPAMLLQIAKHVSDRALAFHILDRLDALALPPLTCVDDYWWVTVFNGYAHMDVVASPDPALGYDTIPY